MIRNNTVRKAEQGSGRGQKEFRKDLMIIAVSAVITIVLMVYSMFPEGYSYVKGYYGVEITGYFGNDTTLEIPSSIHGNLVKEIGYRAFKGCTSLESIEIPDTVNRIDFGAFSECISLESIEIPDSVKEIGRNAFYMCTSLESIEIPDSVKEIGDSAFGWCTSLESIEIPDSVKEIGRNAFYMCRSLESIEIPDSVKIIHSETFMGCTKLKSVSINANTEVAADAFKGCNNISITYR